MTSETRQAAQDALVRDVGPSKAATIYKVLGWLRRNPRTAAELISLTDTDQVEYATRGKWRHRMKMHPDRDTAIAQAQEMADSTGRFVEVWHRPLPDKFLLGMTVHPKRQDMSAQ